MKKREIAKDFNAVIEEIQMVYSSDIAFGNETTYGFSALEVTEFEIPDKEGYATLTATDRERAEKAYPKLRQS